MSRAGRAKLSRLSMILGAALMLAGGGIRAGIIPVAPCGGSCGPGPSDSPAAGTPAAPPAIAVASVLPSAPGPTAPPSPVSSASSAQPTLPSVPPDPTTPASPEPGTIWFADDFDTVAAWPDGNLDWVTTSVAGGQYRVAARVTDLPVVVMAAAGEGSPGADVLIAVRLTLGAGSDPETSAGLVVGDAGGMRLMALVSANGRVSLLRDSIESLEQLASGSITPPAGPVDLTLSLGRGTAIVAVDGVPLASAQAAFAPIEFGIAAWAPLRPATLDVDSYRVWVRGAAQP